MPVQGSFTMKRNDTRPGLLATLSLAASDVISSVKFFMATPQGTLKVNGTAASIVTQPSATSGGQVQYSWAVGDSDTAGQYRGEFEVTLSSGRKETFPNDSYIPINIIPDLG